MLLAADVHGYCACAESSHIRSVQLAETTRTERRGSVLSMGEEGGFESKKLATSAGMRGAAVCVRGMRRRRRRDA